MPGCHSYSKKTKKNGNTMTYHRVPQDDRAKALLDRIRWKNMPPLENSYVCSDHFIPSCFEIDFRAKLIGEKPKRDLKDDAIPSLFSYGPEAKKPRSSSEHRLQRRRHREVSVCQFASLLL